MFWSFGNWDLGYVYPVKYKYHHWLWPLLWGVFRKVADFGTLFNRVKDLELGIWDFLLTHLQGEEVYLSNLVRR